MKNARFALAVIAAVAIALRVAQAAEKDTQVAIHVDGMTCGGCAETVSRALRQIDGVTGARVSFEKHEAVVAYDAAKITPAAIVAAAREKLPGYKLSTSAAAAGGSTASKSCALPVAASPAKVRPSELPAERVTFYEIGLVCPAAPKIGCGSRAKPVLQALSSDARVSGAWLNEAGTRLAIGWSEARHIPTIEQLNEYLTDQGLAANAVSDATRKELFASFHANRGWFDAASVDRLTEVEAGILAQRFVNRLSAKVALTAEQRTILVRTIEEKCRDRIIRGDFTDIEADLVSTAKAARLDATATAALRDVIAMGYEPLEGEQ